MSCFEGLFFRRYLLDLLSQVTVQESAEELRLRTQCTTVIVSGVAAL